MLTAARWCRHAGNTRQTQRLCRAEVVFRTPFCLQTYRSVVVVGVAIVWEPSSDARGRVRPVNFPPSSSGAVRRLAVAVVAVVAVVAAVAAAVAVAEAAAVEMEVMVAVVAVAEAVAVEMEAVAVVVVVVVVALRGIPQLGHPSQNGPGQGTHSAVDAIMVPSLYVPMGQVLLII